MGVPWPQLLVRQNSMPNISKKCVRFPKIRPKSVVPNSKWFSNCDPQPNPSQPVPQSGDTQSGRQSCWNSQSGGTSSKPLLFARRVHEWVEKKWQDQPVGATKSTKILEPQPQRDISIPHVRHLTETMMRLGELDFTEWLSSVGQMAVCFTFSHPVDLSSWCSMIEASTDKHIWGRGGSITNPIEFIETLFC